MQQAKKIFIKSRKNIFGEYIGNNNSLFSGDGFDFHQLSEYQNGDDIKRIDWIISAKLQKPYIKEYFEQKQLNIVLVNMLGGSMHFGTQEFKIQTVANINALLSFIAVKNSDNFSSAIYANRLYDFQKPTKKEYFIHKNIEKILNFKSVGKHSDYDFMINNIFKTINKKSIIFIISDFFEDIDIKLLSKKHEVIAIMVRDRLEESLQPLGNLNIIDPQTQESMQINIDSKTANNYNQMVKKNDQKLLSHFKDNQVRFLKIYTDDNVFLKIAKFFG
jgi:uncharacterized protein (DUF58 family)